jgi:hypothetical protein
MPDMNLRYRVLPEIAARLLGQNRQDALKVRHVLLLIVLGVVSDLLYQGGYWPYALALAAACLLYLVLRHNASKKREEISLSLQEDGLRITHADAQTLYHWSRLREIRAMPTADETGNTGFAIVMDSKPEIVVSIPFAAFADDHEKQAFIAAVNAGIARAARGKTAALAASGG